jgi:sugar diacid utilization regulator
MDIGDGRYTIILFQIFYGNEWAGSILLLGGVSMDSSERQRDLIGLVHSSTIFQIIRMNKDAALEAEDRTRGNLYSDILSGNIATEEQLVVRAAKMNISPQRCHAVVVAQITGEENISRNESADQAISAKFARIMRRAGESISQKCTVIPEGGGWMLILPFHDNIDKNRSARIESICRKILEESAGVTGLDVFLGVSGFFESLLDLPDGYRQANAAIRIGRKIAEGKKIFFHEKMGIYSLLDIEDMKSFRGACTRKIDALTAQCGKNAKTILDTLEAYFDAGESLKGTAAILDIHVNTVKYRIDKSKETLGNVPFEDGTEKLLLHLLLKMRKFL